MRIFLTIVVLVLLGWLIWVFVIRGFAPTPQDVGSGLGAPAVTGGAAEAQHAPG